MMELAVIERLQLRSKQLGRAILLQLLIVAAQVVTLEVVLRGWQAKEAVPVFAGIGASALCFVLTIIIFIWIRKRA